MSLPEVLLWRELKSGKLGVSFRKQHPIGNYKADFCCTEHQLVIEVDGFAHDLLDQALIDERRDALMRKLGFTILRIPASDVLADLGQVLQRISMALPPLHHPSDGPHLAGWLAPGKPSSGARKRGGFKI